MPVYSTKAVTSVVWNGTTYSSTVDGTLAFFYRLSGTKQEDRTGADEWPTLIDLIDRICEVRIRLRNVKQALTLMTKSNLVVTLPYKGGSVTLTFAGMCLYDIGGQQERGPYGSVELMFAYESADGTTAPLT